MANPFATSGITPKESEIAAEVRSAIAENAAVDAVVEAHMTPEVVDLAAEVLDEEDRVDSRIKLSKLIDDDFPFDESQLDAIEGMSEEPYACLTGAAGTGKTTTTKKLVDRLLDSEHIKAVDMQGYWKSDYKAEGDDDYEAPNRWVPSIAMCAFTGRASQMIKKNFPRDWHGNIMTIHRMLGYMPEIYEDWDEESQSYKNKMRFVPTYTADCLMPWDIVIIDEAGMLGVDLWHNLLAACKPGCRIYMIGDINQLPPVHGKSIFGYAMCNWPSWELTHVHRQQGVDNPIVDNAWRIIHGRMPKSEGRFQMIELKGTAQKSSALVQAIATKLNGMGIYDPIRDTFITPINGEDGSRGRELGQLPLNERFALMFNGANIHPRYVIDGGRDRKRFAVGDKVMATKNDWEAGITNGMTGVIQEIQPHAGYSGDRRLFGTVQEVNDYLREEGISDEQAISLEDLENSMVAIDKGNEDKKEKRDRGPSSHIVTVLFGEGDHAFEVPFQSLSEVGSLMTAYVVTCHKMQGGEAPTVIIICHDSHRSMLYREWLYTAVTRASEKCILLYSEQALKTALSKQKMPGATLRQKVLAFNAAQDPKNMFGGAGVQIPHSSSTRNRILDREDTAVVTPARLTTEEERTGGLAQILAKAKQAPQQPKPRITEVHIHGPITIVEAKSNPKPKPEPIDGGVIKSKAPNPYDRSDVKVPPLAPPPIRLPSPPKTRSTWGAAHALVHTRNVLDMAQRLLPAPTIESTKPRNPFA